MIKIELFFGINLMFFGIKFKNVGNIFDQKQL